MAPPPEVKGVTVQVYGGGYLLSIRRLVKRYHAWTLTTEGYVLTPVQLDDLIRSARAAQEPAPGAPAWDRP